MGREHAISSAERKRRQGEAVAEARAFDADLREACRGAAMTVREAQAAFEAASDRARALGLEVDVTGIGSLRFNGDLIVEALTSRADDPATVLRISRREIL